MSGVRGPTGISPLPALHMAVSATPASLVVPALPAPTPLSTPVRAAQARVAAQAAPEPKTPAAAVAESAAADAKTFADAQFRRLTDEEPARASAEELAGASAPVTEPAAQGPEAAWTSRWARSLRGVFRGGSHLPPPAPPEPEAPAKEGDPKKAVRYIYENFLGWRSVRGVVHRPELGRLPDGASVDRIIDQISGEFGVPRTQLLELGAHFRLSEASPRKDWLFVYDWMRRHNHELGKRHDSHKYEGPLEEAQTPRVYPEGWRGLGVRFSEGLSFFKPAELSKRFSAFLRGEKASYRALANRSYADGWRGKLQRAGELHKHFLGVFVRFPYHLFDTFIFGYFRQAVAFEFFHEGEDFFALSKKEGLAKKWLEAGMKELYYKGAGVLGGLRTRTWFRQTERWLVRPLLQPLATFLSRRVTLAVMSAVAMGLLGAFAPVLPLSFALTAIPVLGPGLVVLLNGLPVFTAAVPILGPLLAPVVSAATTALVHDLVLGPLVNTFILSTLMTFPAAVRERLAQAKDQHPMSPLSPSEFAWAVVNATLSWSFWRADLKSFFGLVMVGVEIEGIMSYAGQIDSFLDPAFEAVVGRKVGLLHAIGAAVERPEGESPIPFGGAITWGNVLLYKFQALLGFNISDAVMRATLVARSTVAGESALDGAIASGSAQALVSAAGARDPDTGGLPFDADLWKRPMDEALSRIRELAAMAGGLDAETALVKDHLIALRSELGDTQAKRERLEKISRPVTDAEYAEYARLLRELSAKSDEAAVREKLAEKRDLLHPPSDRDALKRLEELQKRYAALIAPPPPERNGYWEDLAARDASLKSLSHRLQDYVEGRSAAAPGGPASVLDGETRDTIMTLITEIKALRLEAQAELAQRDATSSLLSSVNKTRNRALMERRDGTDMRRIRTDMAKLAVVMDLALALNEIGAAQTALQQMMSLVEAKRAKITASRAQNVQNQAAADASAANVGGWREQVNKDIVADDGTAKDLAESQAKAGMASERVKAFQRDMRAFIDEVNAADRGASADAAAEYQRLIDVVLPQVKEWRTNGGNPNDVDAFSLKKFKERLVEVDDNIKKAQDGLSRLPTVPVEYAGTLVTLIPGPEVTVHNPTPEQVLQILADRRVHWQAKRAEIADDLKSVKRMLDSGNTKSVNDDFGEPHPESLPNWRAESERELAGSQAAARQFIGQLDALTQNVNRTTGSSIPTLGGLALKDLQDALKTFGDKLRAVRFSDDESLATTAAQMDLIGAAKLVPYAAREVVRWSKADATITAIDDALHNVLPKAQEGLTGVVSLLDSVLADVSVDEAWVRTGAGGGQALIDRKTSLLRDKVLPGLQGARSMLAETLIPYQEKSIAQVTGTDTDYFKLYDAKRTLIIEATKLYHRTLPQALATFGAPEGDQGAAAANIAKWRQRLEKNLVGYDDASGHHKGLNEYRVEVANRKDPNFTGSETLYDEVQPFSLPRKISQYSDEFSRRAAEINAAHASINEILAKIESHSQGKIDLSAYRLPTGVNADASGKARIQALVDAKTLPNLGDRLKAIADEALAAGSPNLSVASTSDGTVPVGTQPPIAISANQAIALLSRDTAVRLAPAAGTPSQSATLAVARFLYSHAVVDAATDALNNQIPAAERFIGRMSQALGDAIADIPHDESYSASGGSSETADQVYARKVRVFSSLDAVLTEGVEFFKVKQQWNRDKFKTLDRVETLFKSLHDISVGGQKANDGEEKAVDTMLSSLRKVSDELETKRQRISSWMSQLNPREKSALSNVSEDISKIMTKTRAVLDANIDWHALEEQLGRSGEILRSKYAEIDEKQTALSAVLAKPGLQGRLPAELAREIESLRLGRSGWATGGQGEASSLVIRKSNLDAFIDATLGLVFKDVQSAAQSISAIKAELLKNPQGLQSLIPHSKVLDFGDNADGFYLVYQSWLAVPHGLETGSWVTLGNLGRILGSNVSVTGYQLASPPSKDGRNAPFGDKGVGIDIESVQGENWVNYLNVNMHRFTTDIPGDTSIEAGLGKSRLMIFDDFAMMLLDDTLYVGLAGFVDGALFDPMNKQLYYGGNVKTSVKMTPVVRLDAEQRVLFAKDPRRFLQELNLDFTGYDPTLNRNFRIEAGGDNKNYFYSKIGPQFDLNRLMNPEGGGDTFTLDMYYTKTGGTDDIAQQTGGVSILKAFSIKNDQGRTWMKIDNRLTAEKGVKMDEIGDRLSVSLPDWGLAISGEGRLIGSAGTYAAQISKQFGDRTRVDLSYGSPYIGLNKRLSLTMNTAFTVEELWRKVVDNSAENLRGGEVLKEFQGDLDRFFREEASGDSRTAAELQRVFERDVARQLITQDIGLLQREISELRKAGAILGNTRVRGMVGFISNPISDHTTERAVGGGFTTGTYSELRLTKTEKDLIDLKIQSLVAEGLRLQERLLAITKQWQSAVVDVTEAQWALKMADFTVGSAPSPAAAREAQVRRSDALAALNQAVLRYNAATGRDPRAEPPFSDLSSADLRQTLGNVNRLIAAPDRLKTILSGLDEAALREALGENPFNVVDWLPRIDQLSLGIGLQFQDMLANQALMLGGSVRVPLYDPASSHTDEAYRIESKAVIEEMAQMYAERARAGSVAAEQARIWDDSARVVEAKLPAAAAALSDATRAYRNGLIGPARLKAAFDAWSWYMSSTVSSLSRAAVLHAQAGVDGSPRSSGTDQGPLTLTSIEDAFKTASANSHSLAEIARRQEAAEEMARAADQRIRAWLSLNVGLGMTAGGVGWLPSLGVTGIPVTPIFSFELKSEEMRELQVARHDQQARYYEALKQRVEAGLAVQFYQSMVALRAAQDRMRVFDAQLLPRLQAEASSAGAEGVKRLDEARLRRQQAHLEYAQAKGTLNFLLGRPPDAPLDVAVDENAAMAFLSRVLAGKDPVGAQRAILDARVKTAKAVAEMIDKNHKIEMLQLEPVSLVARALGRVIGMMSNNPVYNEEHAAIAQMRVAGTERERDAYDGRRRAEAARLRMELAAARGELETIGSLPADEARIETSRLSARISSLQAGLMALGLEPEGALAAKAALPKKWSHLKRLLVDSEQALTTLNVDDVREPIELERAHVRAEAFARYYYAHQTLGHKPLNESFGEGWAELRLADPSSSREVRQKLAQLRTDSVSRLYRDALLGAEARAHILAAQFEGDVRLLRLIERNAAALDGAQALEEFNGVRLALHARLEEARRQMVLRLGSPADTPVADFMELVDEDSVPADTPRDLASRLISDIRERQIDSIQRTLFSAGIPASWGSEEGLIDQIKADRVAERMSYKGFTPVVAFGLFRGRPLMGAFLEAPDPREIETGLEKLMSDVLRKELKSNGRLQELSVRLHSLMLRVEDGAKSLEARGRLIEAAESELRSRTELSAKASQDTLAAQKALIDAWKDFIAAMTSTKADFIALVTELEALGESSSGGLRPFVMPDRPEMRGARSDPKDELLDYWARRFSDPSFESAQDELLARMGPAVTAEQRAHVRAAAAAYRNGLRDADSVQGNDYTALERLDLLTRVDIEGKRLALRGRLLEVLRGVGLLDPAANPAGGQFLSFMRADLKRASEAFALERGEKVRIGAALAETYWRAREPSPKEAASFRKLAGLDVELEGARDELLASYLSEGGAGAKNFLMKNIKLDAYLKAEEAFDAALASMLDEGPSTQGLRALEGLYDVRGVLDRAAARARHGRGLAALDALIMLESSRLRAARWTAQTPARIDPIAESLRFLKETRSRWVEGKTDLEPVYAVVRLDERGRRTWSVAQWLSAEEFTRLARSGEKDPSAAGAIVRRAAGWFIDRPASAGDTGRYEVVGGIDAADAARDSAHTGFADNRVVAAMHRAMESFDFVAPGELGKEAVGYPFAQIFGPGGRHSEGKVFFFESPVAGKPANALHPLAALSLPPESVVMMLYLKDDAPSRESFPTLRSLESSAQAGDFQTLTLSPRGAATLQRAVRDLKAAELRRGWIEVKLNSFGFALDETGEPVQLYRSQDDFNAQWKAFDNAGGDLEAARRDLVKAKLEDEARKAETAKAKSAVDGLALSYQAAQGGLRESLRQSMRGGELEEGSDAFNAELERRVAEPRFSRLPDVQDAELAKTIKQRHRDYRKEFERMGEASKVHNEAMSDAKLAAARVVNSARAVTEAEKMLADSAVLSLHRTEDLTLGLDAADKAVSVDAPVARPSEKTKSGPRLRIGEGTEVKTFKGRLLAAIVDADGALVRAYRDKDEIEADFKNWSLVSLQAGGDVESSQDGKALTKVRFSHYETKVGQRSLPVLIGLPTLIDRVEGAQSAQWKAERWAYLPFNWVNLPLEIPRAITGIPAEFAGRDPMNSHYLGRAHMYKSEGGSTERHGLARTVLGMMDILNLMPDPVQRFFDPSQFPDKVRVDSALRPDEGLWSKTLTNEDELAAPRTYHLGARYLQREAVHAAENVEAVRLRTLARFQGGVEELTLETRRGRGGWYQSSFRGVELGPRAVSERVADPVIGSSRLSEGGGPEGREGDVVTSQTPGSLFVDRIERRVRVRPGAQAYEGQSRVLEGYGDRVASRGAEVEAGRASLESALAAAENERDAAVDERADARSRRASVLRDWHAMVERIATQSEIERQIAALTAQLGELRDRISFWERYERLLEDARRPPPTDPTDPVRPLPPIGPNPMFWVWAFALFLFASVIAGVRRLYRKFSTLRP